MRPRPAVAALLLSLLVIEGWVWTQRHQFAGVEVTYRVLHLAQMLMLIVVAYLAGRNRPAEPLWSSTRWLILAGLLFSFGGDLINSFLFDLSHIIEPQTLLSIVPFAIAHCLYITCFWRLGRAGPSPFPTPLILFTLFAWPILAASLWLVLVDYEAGPLLKWLSLGYAHMVVLMALVSLWPLKALGLKAWVAAAGGLIFLLSDSVFGAWLTEGRDRPLWTSQVIWVTYFLAQMCMMHVPLMRESDHD